MTSTFKYGLLLILTVTLTGCASTGFDQGRISDEMSVAGLNQTESDIQTILDLNPALGRPFVLGIYFEDYYGVYESQTKNMILEKLTPMLDQLRNGNVVADYMVINNSTVQENTVQAVRVAAARHRADAVLMIDTFSDSDLYLNPLSITYLTFVAAYFVPGTEVDSLGVISGSLWDTRNQYLYATSYSDALVHKRRAPFLLNEHNFEQMALEAATPLFIADLAARFESMFIDPESGFKIDLDYLTDE
ncbi:hypothetical protein [Saccharospirillum mangrovi]|uniref:hypothetical protein n=1 Tax=Saccharospirillum mangrovi TaxID=2161747 RepID=UPI000D3A1188|nr:hypothetical protein [Saccharospirillum mangrovi]